MKIENLKIEPFGLSLDPTLHITFQFTIERPFFVPTRFLGYLFCGHYRVGVLEEYNFEHSNEPGLGSFQNSDGFQKEFTYNPVFTVNLSPRSLEHIENSRNEKGDIHFLLHLKIIGLRADVDEFLTSDSEGEHYLVKTKWRKLIENIGYVRKFDFRISSSDWIHDFVPVFNKTKYQIIEIPEPQVLNADTVVKQKMKEAIDALPLIEEARAKGDWNQVIKESRPIWELANNKQDIEDTFKGELNNDTWGALKDLIQSMFTFSSKFIHRISQNRELLEVNNASKADAELVYAMAFSIVNFISNKLK